MPPVSEAKQVTNAIALLQKYAKKGMVGSQSSVSADAKKRKVAKKPTTGGKKKVAKKPTGGKKKTTKKK